ncbi:glycosyl transferase family group 2-domain-containing protein [Dendryphion nanum]|uniref:Glycosyl transferase family group 2-domain-containing protein n=1 Tax=Dendryphion nanum TaxID=256645 RepID=A0A9P9DAX5_9PLEO|nr:glycosyl transferase family group 2-domain-containing protein [Dendryphion nanum]
MKCEVMVNWLRSKQEERMWTDDDNSGQGVVIKQAKGVYVCCPNSLRYDNTRFYETITRLNVKAAMTVSTRVIKFVLSMEPHPYVTINNGLRLQVVSDMSDLLQCQKHQSGAFVRSEQLLVVWEDDPRRLVYRAAYMETQLMESMWDKHPVFHGLPKERLDWSAGERKQGAIVNIESVRDQDLEGQAEEPRPIVLIQPFLTGCTLILALAAIGSGWRSIAIEIVIDKNWLRMLFLLCVLPQLWLALFFFQALVGNIAQLIGPIDQVNQNSKFYSGTASQRIPRDRPSGLPHVTIQMPVYKEGITGVLAPTITSVKNAIRTYELQGGTANIFVNDDGMQHLTEAEAATKSEFYEENRVGWVARPIHNPNPAVGENKFIRAGKFKKASNMNYALWASMELEAKLAEEDRPEPWTAEDEDRLYRRISTRVFKDCKAHYWGAGNIRMGDYILLIDSDTRVPEDCLLDAVSEMERSPEVAIIQYNSGVMNVTKSFFEKGITFFTNLIYTQIQFSVANGDVAPFVGHNAFLRWSAMQDVAYDCPIDKREKYWSESTVSEDFDMALRLQTSGYLVRLAAYKGRGFQEGVSLTVYDELARWEKYAYGCNELVFHPVKYWFVKGPFTPLFCKFIGSSMPLASKFTIMAYVGTYYALGSAWALTLLNYFIVGWFNGMMDHYYIDSFKVYFAIVVVFTALGNVALAVVRYRMGHQGLLSGLIENFTWIPLLVIFLGGISLHISEAILSHMFGRDMSWGATSKEEEHVTFFEEIPRVLRKFKGTFAFSTVMTAMMVVMAVVVPHEWRINFFTPIWPLSTIVVSHFLLPIVLNPNLMLFTW